jgi:hypothetical protein
MSGHVARKGFLFQDLYLLLRVLRTASESLDSAWRAGSDAIGALDLLPRRFGLEASASAAAKATPDADSLDWDVVVLGESKFEFAEVKSSVVTKSDRIAFWRRLRRELARDSNASALLVPILVVDPSNSDKLNKWQELAQAAVAFSALPPSQEPAGNVLTGDHLLEEALWWMCCRDNSPDQSDPAANRTTATEALTRFELHLHEAQQLELQVAQFIELLFPGGLTDTQQILLLGWLNKRATSSEERRLFTVRELLQEIGILQDAASLAPGTLKDWRVLWNELPTGVRARTRLCLGRNGASLSALRVQQSAFEALVGSSGRALVILAPGGAGKSTFVVQAADTAGAQGDEVLLCGADDLTLGELEELAKAIRFSAALTALRKPEARLFLCIDALDEADASLRKRWAQLLVRIAGLTNVRVLVSMRDAIWRSDGDVRKELQLWSVISLDLWPESIVRELLEPTRFQTILPRTVIDLLRTPILLDLFWRTFVEIDNPDILQASRLQTRHGLLASFWHERLLTSPRHSDIPDIGSRIRDVVSHAATAVGGFSEANLDADGVNTLLSEGVLVREGRLQSRVRFRHPLLRDFSLAQWCLATNDVSEVSQRWNSIQGGLQRHGSLRAIFEALSDPDASIEYLGVTLGTVVQRIVASDRGLASQVAHVLGAREPAPAVDPANWPTSVQATLPAEFARDLLSAARLDGNGAWAVPLEKWSDDAPWFNGDYPEEVWRYAAFLREKAEASPTNAILREQSHQAARKLRAISEASRFASEFSKSDRWLKMQSMSCIIPTLPDQATMEWVEREMPQSGWRTRSFLLEKLIYLAGVDADRAAMIYRQAVGLTSQDGRPVIDGSFWSGVMDHQALEWSLAGKDGKRSLLKEYPVAFLPVAVDLAEALWTRKHGDPRDVGDGTPELKHLFDEPWPDELQEQRERERRVRLGELVDDASGWRCLRGFPAGGAHDRCLEAIHECVEFLVPQSSPDFESSIGILRSSRMASIHMMLFELLLEHRQVPGAQVGLRESVLDSRLYYVSGFEYWIEQGLMGIWPTLIEEDRIRVFGILREMLAIEEAEDDARGYLAQLPADDLPNDLQEKRPDDGDETYRARRRPSEANFDFDDEWTPVQSNEYEIDIGEWPEDFDQKLLRNFARSATLLSNKEAPVEKLKEGVRTSIEEAQILLPTLRVNTGLLEERSRFWVWRGLTGMLACFRRARAEETEYPAPDLVLGCAELALAVLREVPASLPGSLPDGNIWTDPRETGWRHALYLADEALTWPTAADDQQLQSRFVEVIRAAFATDDPMVQFVTSITIRPWHWLRTAERIQMHDELVWIRQKNASVLNWSLSRLQSSADDDRARVFRLLLHRPDLAASKRLADRLGQFVGVGSMHVFENGLRSAAAEVAREAIDSSQRFAFLQDASNRGNFLRGLIFGMKERAKKVASVYPQLAADYGDWTLKTWRILHAQPAKRHESESVVLFAMHWLERNEGQADRMQLKPWWQQLQPLFKAVVIEGGRSDCFTLFFNLREGKCNDLTTPEGLFELVGTFVERIRELADIMDLDQRMPEEEGYSSWRECASHAAEAIDSLRNDGTLRTDFHREQAHKLLTALAGEPIRCSTAVVALHRLHYD